jgi:Linalool dehydratase/isomerase
VTLADHLRGTDHASALSAAYLARWYEMGWVDPETGCVRFAYRRPTAEFIEMPPGPWSDGWTFAFMHAWAPEYVRSLYPRQRDRHLPETLDRRRTGLPLHMADSTAGIGYFGILAAELGDTETVTKLLDFADANLSPTWTDGRLFYPRNDAATIDENGILRANSAMAGNALIPFARLLGENGLLNLHSRNWGKQVLSAVTIHAVDYDVAAVVQAVWDPQASTLHAGFEPGPQAKNGKASFRISALSRDHSYQVRRGNELLGELTLGAASDHFVWNEGEDPQILFDPRKPANFTISAR